MKLLKKKPRSFEIQVADMSLRITVGTDLNEESRAAALSFWEQLQAYALRNPEVRSSKRPIEVSEDAPAIVRELVAASAAAGVGPMFSFRGALTDHVGRYLAREAHDLTVSNAGDYFIVTRKRHKLTVQADDGGTAIAIVVPPSREGIGVATGVRRGAGADALAVVAASCMLAGAAAAGVQAILAKPDGFHLALVYLRKVPGVQGGIVVDGDRIGVAGSVEIAA